MTGRMSSVFKMIVSASFGVLKVGLVEAAHHAVLVVIDHGNPQGIRVTPIRGCAGKIC